MNQTIEQSVRFILGAACVGAVLAFSYFDLANSSMAYSGQAVWMAIALTAAGIGLMDIPAFMEQMSAQKTTDSPPEPTPDDTETPLEKVHRRYRTGEIDDHELEDELENILETE